MRKLWTAIPPSLQVLAPPNGAITRTGVHLRETIIVTHVFVPYRFKRFNELTGPHRKREAKLPMFQNAVQSFRNVFGTFPNSIWPLFSIPKTNGTCATLSSLYPTHKGSPFKTSHHYYYCYCSRNVNVYSWGLCHLVTVIQENINRFRSLWTWLEANCVTNTLKNTKILDYCAI